MNGLWHWPYLRNAASRGCQLSRFIGLRWWRTNERTYELLRILQRHSYLVWSSDLFNYHKPLKSERHREEDGGGERDVGRRVQEVGVHQVVEHSVQLEGPRESVRANIMRNLESSSIFITSFIYFQNVPFTVESLVRKHFEMSSPNGTNNLFPREGNYRFVVEWLPTS